MLCSLCQQDRLLRRSHIIPEFLYQTLYDEKHRLQVLSVIPNQANWQEQKGLREVLFCDDCEGKLSAWERYASLALKGGIPLTLEREGNIIHISGLDYQKFKLFQLSILWRAGISKLQFFKNVNLGNHSETLRKFLLTSNPGSPQRYGCIMIGLKHAGVTFTDIIMAPEKVRVEGNLAYKFVFGGFMWVMLVTNHDHSSALCQCILKSDGSTYLAVRAATEMQNLVQFSKELKLMNRI